MASYSVIAPQDLPVLRLSLFVQILNEKGQPVEIVEFGATFAYKKLIVCCNDTNTPFEEKSIAFGTPIDELNRAFRFDIGDSGIDVFGYNIASIQ
uniref:Uncharacterized protein n=1 Tax=Romanomermis culicivorax TaxID=13658 RepID=A0A915K3A2_ROMCU